jgi:C_GCAxxG_C_C family probable redox protein
MTRAELAANLLATSQMNCAQAVLSVLADELGLDKTTALKIALPFGGGMGRTSGACGAVSGACMALGLRDYGKLASAERKEKVYALVQELNKRFKEIHGSVYCTDLLGCDLSTPQGREAVSQAKLTATKCPMFVATTVTILESL